MAEAFEKGQDPFRCSVCLDPLRDPVTIPCGHSYCLSCISGCWDQDDQKGECSCPQCRERFSPRPALRKNTMLAELMDKMKTTGIQAAPPAPCYAGPGDVQCDLCSERKLKAVKSCLVCLICLCQTHVEPHYNIPALKKHKLVPASTDLQQKICSQHNRLIEVFCCTDQKCICMLCTMDEHKGHDTVSAAAERKEREKQLGRTKEEFLQRIQEREKELRELREAVASYKHSAEEAEKYSYRIFTELLQSIERRPSEVKEQIRAQQKAAVREAEDILEKLEQEIAELRRGDAQLEELSCEEDHVHFIQSFQALKPFVSKTSPGITLSTQLPFEDLKESLSALKNKVEELCKQDMMKISREAPLFISIVTLSEVILSQEPQTREEFLKFSCQLTLDPNTAHRSLALSEGNRKVTGGEEQPYPDHPDRFESYAQVLCEQGFCGRFYWEVEMSLENDTAVEIAVAYKGITGENESEFGMGNDESWCLGCNTVKCAFYHNDDETFISITPMSRIGVYVDHRAGTLSFYNVSDTMTLLHKEQKTFTAPLYPGFSVDDGASVKICSE